MAAKRKTGQSGTKAPTRKRAKKVADRLMRDVYLGPYSKRLDESLKQGTTVTLDAFRTKLGW